MSLIAPGKLACVSTKTPFSTFGLDSDSHCTKPDNASMHVVTANKNIFAPVCLFGKVTPKKKLNYNWTYESNWKRPGKRKRRREETGMKQKKNRNQ